jgi:hypothetical protein
MKNSGNEKYFDDLTNNTRSFTTEFMRITAILKILNQPTTTVKKKELSFNK